MSPRRSSDQPLSVGLDATPMLGQRTGIGHTVGALVDALRRRDALSLSAYAVTWTGRDRLADLLPEGVTPATRPVPARLVRRMWRRFDHPRIERWTGPLDVVHATNFVAPPTRGATVVTVHDLTCVHLPELCTPDTLEYPALIRRALDRGATVHVVSDTVGAEVRAAFSLPSERVVRIYPGLMPLPPGDATSGRRIAGCDRYVLALGTLEPRKNLDALVRAFDVAAAGDRALGLVIAGPEGWGTDRVHAAIGAARSSDRITVLGYVEERARADLLAGATLFAYPSRYEGFGHPPLEAMRAGVPVVAARAGALPEVLGDAALLVDPADEAELAAAITRAVNDPTTGAELATRGRARCQQYTWSQTAAELDRLYHRIAT